MHNRKTCPKADNHVVELYLERLTQSILKCTVYGPVSPLLRSLLYPLSNFWRQVSPRSWFLASSLHWKHWEQLSWLFGSSSNTEVSNGLHTQAALCACCSQPVRSDGRKGPAGREASHGPRPRPTEPEGCGCRLCPTPAVLRDGDAGNAFFISSCLTRV